MNADPAPISSDYLTPLVQRHEAAIFRFLRSMVGDEEIARDLTQETFLKLEPRACGAGRPLVYAVARSCALDHLRRRAVRRRHETPMTEKTLSHQPSPAHESPDRHLSSQDLRRDLLAGLARLPEDQRVVFHLSEIEGLAYARIAEVLGVKPGTIASRKHLAVRKLRDHLRRCGHGA